MIKLKSLLKEADDNPNALTPRTIFNFYYLWWTAVNQPSLVQTNYGREIMGYYLPQFKAKYVKLFTILLQKQIQKYINRKRIDPDFPQIDVNTITDTKELLNLIKKTFRTDMHRRNDNWIRMGEFLDKLASASSSKDIFVYVNQLNNVVHNTGQKMIDKFPNYSTELHRAFNVVDKSRNPELLKNLVDKDLRDLWNQEEQGSRYQTDPSGEGSKYVETIAEGLERILNRK
jgi:hypothetical protein